MYLEIGESWSLDLRNEHRLKVSEQDAEEEIWTYDGRGEGGPEKTA